MRAERAKPFPWPDDAHTFALGHWMDGWSAGQIARSLTEEYGVLVSRNSVIGRLTRTGVSRGEPIPSHRLQAKDTVVWSPELDQTLMTMRGSFNVAETAAKLGLTFHAVNSRLRHLKAKGFTIQGPVKHSPDAVRAARARALVERATRVADEEAEAAPALPQLGGVAFFKLRPHHCRWPLWTEHRAPPADRQFYCGANVASGSWCSEHHRRSVSNAA